LHLADDAVKDAQRSGCVAANALRADWRFGMFHVHGAIVLDLAARLCLGDIP
jgi:hypothetical protein